MIPKVGKVEKIYPTKNSTDTPRDSMSQAHQQQHGRSFYSYLQEELTKKPEQSQVDNTASQLNLNDRVEISPEGQKLLLLSRQQRKR